MKFLASSSSQISESNQQYKQLFSIKLSPAISNHADQEEFPRTRSPLSDLGATRIMLPRFLHGSIVAPINPANGSTQRAPSR
jgi:hypothetical protein